MRKLLFAAMALLVGYAASAQCTSSFTASNLPKNFTEKLRVQVSNTSTPTPTATKSVFGWQFWGDGQSSFIQTGTSGTHNYGAAGTYTVLQVINVYDSVTGIHCTDSSTSSVTVAYTPCATTVTKSVASPSNPNTITFTFNNPMATPNMRYIGSYGDGTGFGPTSSGSVTHTYTTAGTYQFMVVAYDSSRTCSDTTMLSVTTKNLCDTSYAYFSKIGNGLQYSFTNASYSPAGSWKKSSLWKFGDGNTSTTLNANHTYASSGTYNACLVNTWTDTITNTVACIDSSCQIVNAMSGILAGYITQDSSLSAPQIDSPIYKVWLIKHDSTANTLTAIDSLITDPGYYLGTYYQFSDVPAGTYRTKAQLLNGPSTGASYVPTYHISSLMWNSATLISHTGGNTFGKVILMQAGLATSGPGFVGGNISAGAGKGTGNGIANVTVLLLDGANKPVTSTITDANGDYAFSDLPPAAYTVHPEDIGYATTAVSLNLLASAPNVPHINFSRSESKKTITPAPTSITNVSVTPNFDIYPNPAKDKITIEWGAMDGKTANITITDISGKVVHTQTTATSKNAEVNLQQLHKGLYFISIEVNQVKATQKLLLQ